ncbi:hypothetical protein CDL15_Pgr000385 [Punica granatum]|uniref:Uncharacterized protein n=1 Tax=Punica granatum TaxID=22663 RepID=A0A218XT29_PUNGR|nr:hypothetical protein CDL15_Pgr000385 [Punica granatum]
MLGRLPGRGRGRRDWKKLGCLLCEGRRDCKKHEHLSGGGRRDCKKHGRLLGGGRRDCKKLGCLPGEFALLKGKTIMFSLMMPRPFNEGFCFTGCRIYCLSSHALTCGSSPETGVLCYETRALGKSAYVPH